MAKATISFKADSRVKETAIRTCQSLGMDLSTALNIFLNKFNVTGGFPFPVVVHFNEETTDAFKEADEIASGIRQAKRYGSVEEMVADILEDKDEEI